MVTMLVLDLFYKLSVFNALFKFIKHGGRDSAIIAN
jgi:hypothetical protein